LGRLFDEHMVICKLLCLASYKCMHQYLRLNYYYSVDESNVNIEEHILRTNDTYVI
jgi:hypothetical protein